MTEVKIDVRALKASIADVLPVMKRPTSRDIPILTYAAVVSDGEKVYFEASDRFCIVRSWFAFADGDDVFPEFRFFVDIPALTAMKAYANHERITVSENGFECHGAQFKLAADVDWPRLDHFMTEAWEGDDFFTPGTEPVKRAVDPAVVKHIKKVRITPNVNSLSRPWRIDVPGRVKGVIMPMMLND